jgi:hypothetical protein
MIPRDEVKDISPQPSSSLSSIAAATAMLTAIDSQLPMTTVNT